MTKLSDGEITGLFKQHLKVLREGRDRLAAHITASREMITRSRALVVQIDEQISRIERELSWLGSPPRSERVATAQGTGADYE
jgi:hypothetical protein